jgi:hypothetical protein
MTHFFDLDGCYHASWSCLDLGYGHGKALETYFKGLWTLFEHFWSIFY